jgi:predicted dehydrogenase
MNAGASTYAGPSPIEGSGTAWGLLGSWALSPARPTPIHPRRERRGFSALLVSYRSGDMWVPALDGTEALQVEVGHFLDCIERGEKPITTGEAGLRVVKILEAAQMSIKAGGKRVAL